MCRRARIGYEGAVKTALATLLLALAATPGLSAVDPWIGTWVLDTERSSRRADPSPYKRVTIRIGMDDQDRLRVTYDMVGTRGGVTHREWTGRFDGRDYPMHGLDMVMTNAYRRLDDRRYEILVKLDGVPVARAVAAVSADGGTMEVVTTERDAEGREVRSTAVYRRIRAPVPLGNRGAGGGYCRESCGRTQRNVLFSSRQVSGSTRSNSTSSRIPSIVPARRNSPADGRSYLK